MKGWCSQTAYTTTHLSSKHFIYSYHCSLIPCQMVVHLGMEHWERNGPLSSSVVKKVKLLKCILYISVIKHTQGVREV